MNGESAGVIDRIILFSARRRVLVVLLVALATAGGLLALRASALDALPDLSDVQVLVYADWPGRSPDLIEDQVTYPIVTALVGAARVKAVRGESSFGSSFVTVVFHDRTDLYWARSRVLEMLQGLGARLPEGVTPRLGPDAAGTGWVYEYALVDRGGKHTLADLRSLQDWTLRYRLAAVPGVAEVASVGGFVKQFQVDLRPSTLRAYGLSIRRIGDAIRRSNGEVGGRLVEWNGAEYAIRGRGYVRSAADLESVVVGNGEDGAPILLRDVASVHLGPDLRRGLVDLDGEGEVVGGIVVMRHGENALRVIDSVQRVLDDVRAELPSGVEIVTTYDRSTLIRRAIDTLRHTLLEELAVVSLVILVFLRHVPSAAIPIVTIPIAVVLSFLPMTALGVTANVMSLGGIAVAIGAMVDASIVVVEQTHKRLEEWQARGRREDFREVVVAAVREVGAPSVFSLLVIAVSFLPIFALEAQEGRLFQPLAWAKTFSIAIAALLAITLDPALRLLWTRVEPWSFRPRALCRVANALLVGSLRSEESHPLSRALARLYEPALSLVLRARLATLAVALAALLATLPIAARLGSEFMPPLNEGTILYMPTTLPGMSIGEAKRALQDQDRKIRSVPEVMRVFGKAGRAETPTDPAPLSMFETVVTLKPESEWRPGTTWDGLLDELDERVKTPGMPNVWWMPIQTRTEMLATGMRSVLGVKVFGPDLETIRQVAREIEQALAVVPGTRSAFAERTTGGRYLNFDIRRDAIARHGLLVADVQDVIESAIGGSTVSQTVEGRERYSIQVRYARDERSDLESLRHVLVDAPGGAQIPLGELADVSISTAPPQIHDENGRLAGYVFVDVAGRDLGSYVAEAREAVASHVARPPGVHLEWSGQYEHLARARERMSIVVPITLAIIFILLYVNTGSLAKTTIVLLAVPFSAIGAVWLLWILGYHVSVAVWVGLVALLGVDAETGVFMLLYLDLAFDARRREGRMRTRADLREAILEGAAKRLRPKVMTAAVMFLGLLPILASHGTGADVMKRIAAPMVGGIFTSFLMELLVVPVVYAWWKERALPDAESL